MTQSANKQVRARSALEAKLDFREIGREMLRALEQRESILDRVGPANLRKFSPDG